MPRAGGSCGSMRISIEANRWRGLQLSPVEIGAQTTCRFRLAHVLQPMQNGFRVGDSALVQE